MDRAAYGTVGTLTHKNIFASDAERLTAPVVVASGNTVAYGDVVGRITADGKVIQSLDGAVDGSEVPYAVMGETIDATGADTESFVYIKGHFLSDQLGIGAGHSADAIREGLRGLGINLT